MFCHYFSFLIFLSSFAFVRGQEMHLVISQVGKGASYVQENGINLKNTFIEKVSGYKVDYDKRSEFTELIDYVDDNDVSHIIVSELSRIGRRLIETLLFIRDCTEKGICLHILKERIVTLNKDGTKNTLHTNMISMLATVAEIESEQISYRVQSSLQTRYADGRGFNSRVIGYKRDENGKRKNYKIFKNG